MAACCSNMKRGSKQGGASADKHDAADAGTTSLFARRADLVKLLVPVYKGFALVVQVRGLGSRHRHIQSAPTSLCNAAFLQFHRLVAAHKPPAAQPVRATTQPGLLTAVCRRKPPAPTINSSSPTLTASYSLSFTRRGLSRRCGILCGRAVLGAFELWPRCHTTC